MVKTSCKLLLTLVFGSLSGCLTCDLEWKRESSRVIPFQEKSVEVKGCYNANNVTKKNQEVHILLLEKQISKDVRSEISVYIRRRIPGKSVRAPNDRSKMVVALYSNEPVQWKIKNNHQDVLNILFMVSNGSSIVIQSGKKPKTKVRKSKNAIRFVQAILKKFKNSTTVSKIRHVISDVYINDGGISLEKCDFSIANHQISPSIQAFFVQRKPVKECEEEYNIRNGRQFHIIEVKNKVQGEVIFVELLPRSLSSETMISKIVLVLKSGTPVTWRVASKGLQGVLQIMSDSIVEVENLNSKLRIEAKENAIPENVQFLMERLRNRDTNCISYTQVGNANKIRLIVRPKRKAVENMKLKENSKFGRMHQSNIQKRERSPFFRFVESSKNSETSTSSQMPSSIGQTFDRKHPRANFKEHIHRLQVVQEYQNSLGLVVIKPTQISALEIAVMRSLKIECQQRRIIISIDKGLIESLITKSLEIALANPKCNATLNSTHYTLSSELQACWSDVLYQNDYVVIQNHVKFGIKPMKVSGLPPVPDHIKLPQPISFQCKYQLDHETNENTSGKVKFAIKLYKDMEYKQELTDIAIPLDIQEDKIVYVHVFADIHARDLGLLIDKCWVSTSNHDKLKNISSDLLLIEDNCPVDDNSQFLQGDKKQKPSQKFSFKVHKRFSQSFLFVHCNFSLCHKQIHRRIVQCVDVGEVCKNKRANLSHNKEVRLIHKTAGPLRVLGKKPDHDTDDKTWIDEMFKMSDLSIKDEPKIMSPVPNKKSEPQQIILLGLTTGAIAGIGFASFVMGAVFMGVLWCIYVRTEPRRQRRNNGSVNVQMQSSGYNLCPQTTIHSGSSTPNSQTPMSA